MLDCGADNSSIIYSFYQDDNCAVKKSDLGITVMDGECFQSKVNQEYFKQYIGGRTERFQLPPYLNSSFSKENLGATF